MDRDQLIDLTRRALKLARDKTTDLTPAEHTVAADTYTSAQRHAEDKSMLLTSPQLVGYSSELPRPGTYGTKTVMGRSILLTRSADNTVRAFDNVCLHRQSRIADGCGAARRLACPYHAWTYDLDGNLVGVPGKEGFPETRSGPAKLTELPAAECAGFLWISLDRDAKLDIPRFLGPLADELESWGIGRWSPLGEKVLACPINWKLAIDTFAENYHFATVHKATFATIARSNCTVFDSFGPHHRLVFPLNGILDLESLPEEQWDPLHNMVVIYALFPNIVLSCRQWGAVPRLSRRYARPVDHRAPELDPVGSVRRVGGRGCGGGLRLRVRHGPRRGLRARGRLTGQPGVRCTGEFGFRPQRTRAAAPPSSVGSGP